MKSNLVRFSPSDSAIFYSGRIDFEVIEKPKLSSAGSFFSFMIKGNSCFIELENQHDEPGHNYISVEIDGEYQGRTKIEKGITRYQIAADLNDSIHTILVCKATESFIGYIQLNSIECRELLPLTAIPEHKIEFIGNSITSGAQIGEPGLSCDSGEWHDHNNALLAYGPQLAKSLNAQWVLSSISGMGLTRNWNDEGPGVPAFYDNLYLDKNSDKAWKQEQYTPQLVTICLGTNDISGGDGSYNRQDLDSSKFIAKYLEFIQHIIIKYPEAKICLLNSPTFGAEDAARFDAYLRSISEQVNTSEGKVKLHYYTWSGQFENGCTSHPGIDEHQVMAGELEPFVRNIMGW